MSTVATARAYGAGCSAPLGQVLSFATVRYAGVALDGEGSSYPTLSACNRGNGMSSFPEDTEERFVGEGGVHDAGPRAAPSHSSVRQGS